MVPTVPKLELSCLNYPNLMETVENYTNVSNCIQITMKHLHIS